MNSNSYEVNNTVHVETNCDCKFTVSEPKPSGYPPINVMGSQHNIKKYKLPADPFTHIKELNVISYCCISRYSTGTTYILLSGVNFASL